MTNTENDTENTMDSKTGCQGSAKTDLSLYVWAEFSPDYKDGLAFAVAKDIEQAKEMVRVNLYGRLYLDKDSSLKDFFREAAERLDWGPVQVLPIDQSVAFAVQGGE